MKTMNVYTRDKICPICKQDRWIEFPTNDRIFLYAGNDGFVDVNVLDNGKYIISLSIGDNSAPSIRKDEKDEICVFCFEALVGLENHFDAFFPDIVRKHKTEASEIVQKIRANKKWKKIFIAAKNGNGYFPKEMIEEVKGEPIPVEVKP